MCLTVYSNSFSVYLFYLRSTIKVGNALIVADVRAVTAVFLKSMVNIFEAMNFCNVIRGLLLIIAILTNFGFSLVELRRLAAS